MIKKSNTSRRNFLIKSSLASGSLLIPSQPFAHDLFNLKGGFNDQLQVFLFSKHLQFLNYKEMAEVTKEMGFDGVDLTVRRKGHVLPERVSEDLPKATEEMKNYELKPLMISTNVIDPNNKVDQQVLKTANDLGYRFYRPAWVKYNSSTPIMEVVENTEKQFIELVNINKKLNLSATYHNHSGHYFGASIWDLYQVLEQLPKDQIGCQYDIMHAAVEGGKSWEVGLKLISPYINTLVVKDFVWGNNNGKWDRINVPMGEGMVDFKRYFSLLKEYKINVPVSIHVEHDLGGAEHGGNPTISHKEVFKRIKKDLDFLRATWKES